MNMKKGILTALVSSFLLSACTTPILTTETWSPAPSTDRDAEIVGSYWLPVAKFPVTIKRAKCVVTIDVGDATFVPDGGHHYKAVFHHNAFTADDVALGTDNSGLLQTVNASSDPQYSAKPNYCDQNKDVNVTLPIDLTSPNADAEIRTFLPDDMTVHITATRVVALAERDANSNPGCVPGASGVCYRPAWPYKFTISVDDPTLTSEGTGKKKKDVAHQNNVTKQIASVIPDPEQIMQVRLDRNGPTKSDIKMEFNHGVLTKYENNQPSTALAWIGIPADILKGVLGLAPSSGSAAGSGTK